MNLLNLNRDQTWLDPQQVSIGWPTVDDAADSDGVVNQDIGYANSSGTTDATALRQHSGVWMQQPKGENTAYRVKIYSNVGYVMSIAYATSAAITGTNDLISAADEILIPIGQNYVVDDIFNIKATDDDKPLFFGIRSTALGAGVTFQISVQRLNITPPRFASVIS